MLGDRDVRRIIEKAIDKIYDESKQTVDKVNPERIHAFEVSHCTRLSYYDRKDPLPDDNAETISILMKNSIRRLFNNIHGEYKVNNLTLEVTADMIINDEFVVRFEIIPNLPEIPHPRDLLYINACLFSFNKNDGILIYITGEGKSVEFSITKNNRMFEEIIRRARILSTLLKENKVPIIEPCDLCLRCKYYERCYSRERKTPSSSLENLLNLGLGKEKSN